MQKNNAEKNLFEVWEDLVDDFLDIQGKVSAEKRKAIISKLKESKVNASEIHRIPCFAIDGRVVLLLKQNGGENCIVFDPQTQTRFWD